MMTTCVQAADGFAPKSLPTIRSNGADSEAGYLNDVPIE